MLLTAAVVLFLVPVAASPNPHIVSPKGAQIPATTATEVPGTSALQGVTPVANNRSRSITSATTRTSTTSGRRRAGPPHKGRYTRERAATSDTRPHHRSARRESVRISRRPFETIELIENQVDGGGRDPEVCTLRDPETVADVGEQDELTLDVSAVLSLTDPSCTEWRQSDLRRTVASRRTPSTRGTRRPTLRLEVMASPPVDTYCRSNE